MRLAVSRTASLCDRAGTTHLICSVERKSEMESLKLKMPTCPQCHSRETRIDISDYSNLVRIPAAVASAGMIGIPLASMAFVCKGCGARFNDKGTD